MADSLRNEYRVVRLMNSCSVTFFGFVYNPTTLEHLEKETERSAPLKVYYEYVFKFQAGSYKSYENKWF